MWPAAEAYLAALAQCVAVYYGAAAALHFGLPRLLPGRKIQPAPASAREARRDAGAALAPLAVRALALSSALHLRAAFPGLSRLYSGPVTTAWDAAYLVISWAVLDLLHDSYFYWAHRLLHAPWLYRRVHYVHHRARSPTAFSGYAFHPAEALLVFALYPLETLALPLHSSLHRLYHLYTIVIHVGGHCGHELAPCIPTLGWLATHAARLVASAGGGRDSSPRSTDSSPSRPSVTDSSPGWNNTVGDHDAHHSCPGGHFSLYFTHWDRWCGTQGLRAKGS